MLHGVPNERMKIALREEMEAMGLGDETIRKAFLEHPLVDLLHAIQTVINKPDDEHLLAMQQWLRGDGLKSSQSIARQSLDEIKGVLNAGKTQKDRSSRAGGTR